MLRNILKNKHPRNRFSKLRCLILVLFCHAAILSTESFAQRWVSYSTPHGLAGESVRDILVGRNREIWFATNFGISKFNGQWTNYRDENGLINNDVTTVVQDGDGNVWFGTNGGISRIDPTTDLEIPANWHNYTIANTDNGLSSNRITSILFDNEGKIWFGTEGRGISVADPTPDLNKPYQDPLRDAKNWVTFTRSNGLSSNTIFELELDAAGNIWVATTDTVNIYKFACSQWIRFLLQPDDANQQARAIFRDKNDNVWIGTKGSGVYRVHPNNMSTYDQHYTTSNSGLAENCVLAIAQDREGAMWFGHDSRGVSMMIPDSNLSDASNWQNFTIIEGLANNSANSITEDMEENIWFGHPEDGVSQLDRTWLSFLVERETKTNFVNGLFPDKQRSFWVATNGGAVKVNLDANLLLEKNQKNVLITSNSGLSANRVFAVFQDSKSFLWFGTEAGANRVPAETVNDNSQWQTFNRRNGQVFSQVNWITEDRLGYIWLATDNGVSRVHIDSAAFIGSWTNLTQANGLASINVRVIHPIKHPDGKDNLLFATDKGISVFNPELNPRDSTKWISYNTSHGLINNNVRFIYEDTTANLWFATIGGVSRIALRADWRDFTQWKSFTTEDGLASNFVTSITQFDDDFWFGTSVGASRFEMDANQWTTYTTASGLRNNFIVALFADRNNKEIWFGTKEGGVTRYTPKPLAPQTLLSTHYDVVTVNRITFKYHGADIITTREDLRYSFKLDDQEWSPFMASEFASIPVEDSDKPQRHVFQVRAIDRDGNVDPKPAKDVFYKINAQLGGNVEITNAENRVRLYVPPGVLRGDTSITIAAVERFDAADSVIVAYDFSPKPFKLTRPVTLSISFPNTQASNYNQIAIFRRDNSSWTGIGGTVTSRGNLITVTTVVIELDTFAVRNIRVPRSERAIAEVSIQPRVFSPNGGGRGHGERANISFALKDDAAVSVKVYDLAGRLKRVIEENVSLLAGTNVVVWDGRDDDGRFCVSGLYVVTIEAEGRVQTKTVIVANKYD